MNDILFYLGLVSVMFFVYNIVEMIYFRNKIPLIKDVIPLDDKKLPKVSIIITACNEETKIREALKSICKQNYPNYEVIAVNDRSTDKTGEIISELKIDLKNLKQLDITELPEGWLGKCNALQKGSEISSGEIILFADADIQMKPNTLRNAVSYLLKNNLDHLAVSPDTKMPGFILPAFVNLFSAYLSIFTKPWRAKFKKSKYSIGIGAFNLVRKSVYEKIGGHESIKMRPEDDLKLGQIIKTAGFQQEFALGKDLISVEWYSNINELIKGLEKNSFAAFNYSYILLFLSLFPQLLLNVFPFIAVFITSGITQYFFIFILIMILGYNIGASEYTGAKWWSFFLYPFMTLLFVYIQINSMIYFIRYKGIDWRGTHYNLKDLKANNI